MPGPAFRSKEFSGQTLTALPVRLDTDAEVGTARTGTEAANAACIYTFAALADAPPVTGMYAVKVSDSSGLIRTYYAYLLTSDDDTVTVDLHDWPVDALLARGVLTVAASGDWATATQLGTPSGASIAADIAAVKAETAAVVADTNELQSDWADGGRLDLILDGRASQSSVDTIDGIVDAILVDTGTTLQGDLTTLLARLTASRASYLDNLNIGGAVASQADITALNQSASRRVILVTVVQYERPESGSTVYTVEARTYDGDGAAVNADSNPTLTGTGATSGSLAANIGTIANPSTGVYRWDYTVADDATLEPVRFDLSATIGASTFTQSAYTQVVDLSAATWTTADAAKLTAIYDKLPSRDYIAGSTSSSGAIVTADVGLASANLDAQLGDIPTVSQFNARTLPAADYFDPATDTVAHVTLVDTTTTNTDMRGTDGAYTGTPPTVEAIRQEIDANSTKLTGFASVLSGITSLGDWLRRIVRKDAGTAGMVTAESEIDTGGTSTFSGTTDSLEAIRDASGGGGGGEVTGFSAEAIDQLEATFNGKITMAAQQVTPGALLRLVQGAAYKAAYDNEFTCTISDPPDLTGWTPYFGLTQRVAEGETADTLTVAGTFAAGVATFEFTGVQTAALAEGEYDYYVYREKAGDKVVMIQPGESDPRRKQVATLWVMEARG